MKAVPITGIVYDDLPEDRDDRGHVWIIEFTLEGSRRKFTAVIAKDERPLVTEIGRFGRLVRANQTGSMRIEGARA